MTGFKLILLYKNIKKYKKKGKKLDQAQRGSLCAKLWSNLVQFTRMTPLLTTSTKERGRWNR